MMVGLLVYAYAVGERSSRAIERRCIEDVGFRVITGNQVPDHATIARFRATHEAAFAVVFGHVLALCQRAGLVQAGVIAIDGTGLRANASKDANRTAEQLAAEILAEAADPDAREDAELGVRRGDELPEHLAGPDRKARLRGLLAELKGEAEERSYERQVVRRQEIEAQTGQRIRGRKPKPDSRFASHDASPIPRTPTAGCRWTGAAASRLPRTGRGEPWPRCPGGEGGEQHQ